MIRKTFLTIAIGIPVLLNLLVFYMFVSALIKPPALSGFEGLSAAGGYFMLGIVDVAVSVVIAIAVVVYCVWQKIKASPINRPLVVVFVLIAAVPVLFFAILFNFFGIR